MVIIKRLTILIALLFCFETYANPEYARQQQALGNIIKLANLDKHIAAFPAKFQQQLLQLTTPTNNRRVAQIHTTFDPDMMRQAFRRQINLSVLTPDYELLITRLRSPHLHKMLQMERDALGVVAYYERPIFIQHSQRRPASKQRQALIAALDQVMGRSELLILADAMLRHQLQDLLKPSSKQLLVNRAIPTTELDKPHVRQQIQQEMLYTYRNASDEELSIYIAFYRSQQGEMFINSFNGAWLAAISDITRDIAWRLKQPSQTEPLPPAVYVTRQ